MAKTSTAGVSRRCFMTGSAAMAAVRLAWPTEDRRLKVCVLGASGTVGNAIMRATLNGGHQVIAISRSTEKLAAIRTQYAAKGVTTLVGDVASDESAARLHDALQARFGKPDAIVAALSAPAADRPMKVLGTPTDALRRAFDTNFFTHVVAAKALIPELGAGAVYVGINGGLPDFVIPGMANLTMTQSALRSLYLALAQEADESQVQVRMLGLFGLVATQERPVTNAERSILDADVGRRVLDILLHPSQFPGPILAIRARAYS
jgi:NAD(P)-dependent dehydrogenase (short-subunit alcohol dehydrogenase family)